MLNKELMPCSAKADTTPHVMLEVGMYATDWGWAYWGYSEQNLAGGLSKIPYWAVTDDRGTAKFVLRELSYEASALFQTGILLEPLQTTSVGKPEHLYVTVNGVTASFYPRDPTDKNGPSGDPFGFAFENGTTCAVTFNPPPTGYL